MQCREKTSKYINHKVVEHTPQVTPKLVVILSLSKDEARHYKQTLLNQRMPCFNHSSLQTGVWADYRSMALAMKILTPTQGSSMPFVVLILHNEKVLYHCK